nr:MAG TPA: hypothetical protein [Caudoviricetes sp.]
MRLPRCAYLRAGVTALPPGKWFYIFTFTLSFTLTFTFTLGFQIQNQWFMFLKSNAEVAFATVSTRFFAMLADGFIKFKCVHHFSSSSRLVVLRSSSNAFKSSSEIRYSLPMRIAGSFFVLIQSHTVMIFTPYLSAISPQLYIFDNLSPPNFMIMTIFLWETQL